MDTQAFIAESCNTSSDCAIFDCVRRCDPVTRRCGSEIANGNLQLLCKRVFLGWIERNVVDFPGLLMSRYASNELKQAVLECSEQGKLPAVYLTYGKENQNT